MPTTLAEQLKNLAAPQSSVYKDDKKKASLLFDPKEAATKDRDTIFDIGLSGLKDLQNINPIFRQYEDSLFNITSKDFQRAVQSKETNAALNETIQNFLLHLSPYLLLTSSHKTLEWLVNRYSIQEYNQNEIFMLILPYHETKIFVRFIQIMDLKADTNRWNWLEPLQKKGVQLAKQVLYNHCSSSSATLSFIAKSVLTHVNLYGEMSHLLTTVFGFFCSSMIGSLEQSKKINETQISAILPILFEALDSPIADFRYSAYMICGYLTSKTQLKAAVNKEILIKTLSAEHPLTYEKVLLANIMCAQQEQLDTFPIEIVFDISAEEMYEICNYVKIVMVRKINTVPFVTMLLSSLLVHIQENIEDFKRLCNLPSILLDELDFKECSEDVIKCVLDSFEPSQYKDGDGYESDLEIIEDEKVVDNDMTAWYSQLLKNLELKYPSKFDAVVKQALNNKITSEMRKAQLTSVLGFKASYSHKIGDTFLFEKLNHSNPTMRTEACKFINKNFMTLKNTDQNFLIESLKRRFDDDSSSVILTILKIPISWLEEIFTKDELTDIFIKILRKKKNSEKWIRVVIEAIELFQPLETLRSDSKLLLTIFPLLFPSNKPQCEIFNGLVNSVWAKNIPFLSLIKNLQAQAKVGNTDYAAFCEITFSVLERGNIRTDVTNLDNYDDLEKDTLSVVLVLLLKCNSLEGANVEDISKFLNYFVNFIKNIEIVATNEKDLSGCLMPLFIENAKKNVILFPFLSHIFRKIVKFTSLENIKKPWNNFCETEEGLVTKLLFETFITGCGLPNYSKGYAKVLKSMLDRICKNTIEKIEFCANFACGHIFSSDSPKNLISPELQLRSLQVIRELLHCNDDITRIFDSSLNYCLLFCLKSKFEHVRLVALEIIAMLLKTDNSSSNPFRVLFGEINSRKYEISLDNEQISMIMFTLLSQEKNVRKGMNKSLLEPMKRCHDTILTKITDPILPSYVTAEILDLLKYLNSVEMFSKLSILCSNIMNSMTEKNLSIYDSKILSNVVTRISTETVKAAEVDNVWKFLLSLLNRYEKTVIVELNQLISPCELLLKRFNNDIYKLLTSSKRSEFIKMVCLAGTYATYPSIVARASKFVRKIELEFDDFQTVLEDMSLVKDPVPPKNKKRNINQTMLSYHTAETKEWKTGVTLLEYLQSQKQLKFKGECIEMTFIILQKCLNFEEQTYVEYTKQLVMSTILHLCQKVETKAEIKVLKSMFDIESVVKCIRGTQNPQTHQHALMLLAHAAHLLPEQVLNHIMAIFTFIGTSVLRHDDAYSFQIIVKIIETIIPILVGSKGNSEDYDEKELEDLQSKTVPVLRIFAEVVLDVPEHRRVPLYKKLVDTLGANKFLWVMLALFAEAHVKHFSETKPETSKTEKVLRGETPTTRIDAAKHLLMEFPPEIIMENLIKLIQYLKTLPEKKEEDSMDTDINSGHIFSVNGHSALQLRHFRYTTITFMNGVLSSGSFRQHARSATKVEELEKHFKTYIVNILIFITNVSKINDEAGSKYWKVILHHSYDLLDNVNNLLSAPMFIAVVKGLLNHNLHAVRRKALDLLNSKIQFDPEVFENTDRELLFSLLPALLTVVETLENQDDDESTEFDQEKELNQQTALLSLKLLTRMIGAENPIVFKPVLEKITGFITNQRNIAGNVMASIVLCLAELCTNLKAHTISYLPRFMPALIKILKKQRTVNTPELILLSTITAVSKIVENLPLFLSPYLKKIIFEFSVLMSKWQGMDQECPKVVAVMSKLANIKSKIAVSIAPRVLVPVISDCFNSIVSKEIITAVGPAMSILAENFTNFTNADFTWLQQELSQFFVQALQLRCDHDTTYINDVEDEVINALVCLVLKLSESSFRPFYFKLYDWAVRSNLEDAKDRLITFYRMTYVLAERLKGLFVLFAGHFIKHASEMLDSNNNSKVSELYFEAETKSELLIENILNTLRIVFLYDSQNFLNKERFEILLQPIVDQLENTIGGMESLKRRSQTMVIPCVAQLAVTLGDDSLWKPLNYQILLKMRHGDPEIRLLALECFVKMASQLGTNWLPLLAESVPFLAELLEDGDARVEAATKEAIRNLETILGESLQKYL